MGDLPQKELLSLLQKAKRGDRAAFEKIYTELFLPVYRYILKRVLDKTTSEDLTQTVFLRVYTSHTPFEDRSLSPLAYFFTVAKNVINDHFRKTQKPISVLDEKISSDIPENFHHTLERRTLLQKGFEELEEIQKQILQMKFFDGFSTEEIARKLNTSNGNIRQIQCRSLKKLRELLSYE